MLKNYPTNPKHASILYMLFFVLFTLSLVSFPLVSFPSLRAHSAQPASPAFSSESSIKILAQKSVQNPVQSLGQNPVQSLGQNSVQSPGQSSVQNSIQNSDIYYAQNSGSSTGSVSSQTGLSTWPPRSDSQKQEKSPVQVIRGSATHDQRLPVQDENGDPASSAQRTQQGQLGSASYVNNPSPVDQSAEPLVKSTNSASIYDSEQKEPSSELGGRSGRTLFKDSPQAGGIVPVITPSTAFRDDPGGSINGVMGISASEVPISSWSANATRALLRYTESSPVPGSESMPQLIPLDK